MGGVSRRGMRTAMAGLAAMPPAETQYTIQRRSPQERIVRQRSMRVVAVAGLALVAGACSSSDTTGPGGSVSTTFSGIVAGDSASGNVNGSITLTVAGVSLRTSPSTPVTAFVVASATTYNVTGTFKPSGAAAISLAGTYDVSSGTLSVSGSGFSFTGTLAGGVLSGTLTTQGGGAGSFSA